MAHLFFQFLFPVSHFFLFHNHINQCIHHLCFSVPVCTIKSPIFLGFRFHLPNHNQPADSSPCFAFQWSSTDFSEQHFFVSRLQSHFCICFGFSVYVELNFCTCHKILNTFHRFLLHVDFNESKSIHRHFLFSLNVLIALHFYNSNHFVCFILFTLAGPFMTTAAVIINMCTFIVNNNKTHNLWFWRKLVFFLFSSSFCALSWCL